MVSLGCPRNLVDSQEILERLDLKGYPIVDIDKADVAIVNTCAFIEEAKRESIDTLLDAIDLKKNGSLKKIIVYGCLSQRYKEILGREFPEIDAFVGKIDISRPGDGAVAPQKERARGFSLTPGHLAYLKISEGCRNNCSFCIIPKIKGKMQSLPEEEILRRVDQLDKRGVRELNIIGQDISAYGLDLYGKTRLADIVSAVSSRCRNISWIRLLYLYPSRIDSRLLDIISSDNKICKYIDLPLQHISARILRLMNRHIEPQDIFKLLDKIRRKIPEGAMRTALIVGFPSETDKDFKQLCKFVRDIRFERLGVFIYSREEGTRAFGYKQQIPHKVKVARFNEIMSIQQEVSRRYNKSFFGRSIEVMVEEKADKVYTCRSQHDAPEVDGNVFLHTCRLLEPGDIVRAKITDTLEYDLVGSLD